MDSSTSASKYRAPALEKGLDIIELLADRPDGLTQTEIARSLNRSVGEIFRMVTCLVDRGFICLQRPNDRYVLTLKMFELSHRHPPLRRILAHAIPVLHQVAHATNQSCHLTVVEGGRGVVIAQADGPGEMGFGVRPGSVMDLTRSASGHVLLAFQTPEDRRRILSPVGKGGADIDADTKTLKELDRVREQGFEEMDSTRLKGIHDISYPVFDHRKSAVAAMTIPYIERLDVSGGMPVADVRAILGKAVAALSLTLGGGADSNHA